MTRHSSALHPAATAAACLVLTRRSVRRGHITRCASPLTLTITLTLTRCASTEWSTYLLVSYYLLPTTYYLPPTTR